MEDNFELEAQRVLLSELAADCTDKNLLDLIIKLLMAG